MIGSPIAFSGNERSIIHSFYALAAIKQERVKYPQFFQILRLLRSVMCPPDRLTQQETGSTLYTQLRAVPEISPYCTYRCAWSCLLFPPLALSVRYSFVW